MRIALVTDAWTPQVNGVVRTLGETVRRLRARGHAVLTVTPDRFFTLPCPSYPEIRLALGCRRRLARLLREFAPDALHIATEGPLGWAARGWARRHGMPFTTSFHTRFPDYVALRTGLSPDWIWPIVRRFHRPAKAVFAATEGLEQELRARGLPQTHRWSRGVDDGLFSPRATPMARLAGLPAPIQLYVGRVAVEKNIEAFLNADVGGSKIVVGDGPALAMLRQRFPAVCFLGALHGQELASAYAAADVFVFPSRTDTFGLVMVEALSSGVPVAGYPVAGPLDVVGPRGCGVGDRAGGRIGAVDEDLAAAIRSALTADPALCRAEGQRYSWDACTDQFQAGLHVRPSGAASRSAFVLTPARAA